MISGRSHPARALAALALALLAAAGCGDDGGGGEEPEAEDRAIVKLSFDEIAYVDAAITTRKMIERVRHENESVFSALRRADVMITARKLVDVDLAHLEKEPVTVVDLDTGITRAALRLRYHFLALALAPRPLAARGDVMLGALHTQSPGLAERVLADCTANGDRERAAITEPWTVFDAGLDRCGQAIAAEQAAIDARRRGLASPDKEIVSREFERLYVPVVVHLRERQAQQGGEPMAVEHVAGEVAEPADAPAKAWNWADKAREKDFEDAEDERALQRMSRPAGGGMGPQRGAISWSSNVYLQPNFTLLYVVVLALVLLLVGWRRQDQRKRR